METHGSSAAPASACLFVPLNSAADSLFLQAIAVSCMGYYDAMLDLRYSK